jgi:isopenicillin N synthase-like dioxygenase
LLLLTLPIIDLAPLLVGGEAGLAGVSQKLGAACRDLGFLYVVNHGVEEGLIDAAFAQSRRLFALRPEDKQALAIERVGGNRGYSGYMHEALDPARGPDRKEAFNIGFELSPDDPRLLARQPFRAPNVWPSLPEFRSTLLAYYDACASLGALMHRAVACDLGLSPDFFVDKFDAPMATLRLLRYPADAPGAMGAGAHTDYGSLTLLAADAVGGLEVRTRSGDWIKAPPLPGAFVVNIGDCLMRWTNDVYVSTPHRVVSVGGGERYSIAFFYDPNPDAVVAAIPSCVSPNDAPRYAPILAADYLKTRLDASIPPNLSDQGAC